MSRYLNSRLKEALSLIVHWCALSRLSFRDSGVVGALASFSRYYFSRSL